MQNLTTVKHLRICKGPAFRPGKKPPSLGILGLRKRKCNPQKRCLHGVGWGVSHEIREDGYYYVPMDIRNELMQYAEQFDDPSDSDGEGVTHEDQEPKCDPEPPASSSSSSSRKPAPKGPRGVTSKTRVSPTNHGPARATVV